MKFCRINLHKTNYEILPNANLLKYKDIDVKLLQDIYKRYCIYKKFKSVMPIFPEEFYQHDIIVYKDLGKIVAFSMIGIYNSKNLENYQFAWNYEKPGLRLGIESLKHECAYYKAAGYDYFYLGEVDEYKKQFDGFEVLKGYN
tara:strand:- start:1139 stop:1567 length:429 start_codon:yes stop_codon:yes gene_type:complete